MGPNLFQLINKVSLYPLGDLLATSVANLYYSDTQPTELGHLSRIINTYSTHEFTGTFIERYDCKVLKSSSTDIVSGPSKQSPCTNTQARLPATKS